MGQRREVYVLFRMAIIMGLILAVVSAVSPANALPPLSPANEPPSANEQVNAPIQAGKAGRFGLGVDLSAVNFTMGPMVKYWLTENIGGQLTYSAVGGFTGYSIKGIYEFTKAIDLNPYLGIGYTSISKKESYAGVSLTYKGSGPSFSGGLEGSLKQLHPNLYYTTEFVYSPFDLEAKYENDGYDDSTTVTSDFSSFGLGMSMVYYF